jgi:hypothetical protein
MKWEAKRGPGDYPVATAALTPWLTNDPEMAKAACRGLNVHLGILRDRFDLISNEEWMEIAHAVEAIKDNWVGDQLKGGHIHANENNSPMRPLDGQTANVAPSGEKIFDRRLYVNQDEVVWDLSGNVFEIVDWTRGGPSLDKGPRGCACNSNTGIARSLADVQGDACRCSGIAPAAYLPAIASPDLGKRYVGLAHICGDDSPATVVFRGGYHSHGTNGGIFFFGRENLAGANYAGKVGFRCVYRLGDI